MSASPSASASGSTSQPARQANEPLTAAEVADILGVKRQTIYAYVSRGILHRRVALDGRTSLFDRGEVEELRLGRRASHDGELRTILATSLTNVSDEGLTVRGHDLVRLVSEGARFVEMVELTWSADDDETWPTLDTTGWLPAALDPTDPNTLTEQLRALVAMAAASDPLRHDLSPRSVRAAGRRAIVAMATAVRHRHPEQAGPPGVGDRSGATPNTSPSTPTETPGDTMVAALWTQLSAASSEPARLRALDVSLALLVDHGLATSAMAARMAASVRADPYSVIITGLGVLAGPLHGRASGAVHELYEQAEEWGAAAALGRLQRRGERVPGVGHSVYRQQDPRYGALMEQVIAGWGGDARLGVVFEVRDLLASRGDRMPNVDLAIGALTFLAGMPLTAGEVLFAVARTAGWLAHALEEYGEQPLRFRTRGHYVGPRPGIV